MFQYVLHSFSTSAFQVERFLLEVMSAPTAKRLRTCITQMQTASAMATVLTPPAEAPAGFMQDVMPGCSWDDIMNIPGEFQQCFSDSICVYHCEGIEGALETWDGKDDMESMSALSDIVGRYWKVANSETRGQFMPRRSTLWRIQRLPMCGLSMTPSFMYGGSHVICTSQTSTALLGPKTITGRSLRSRLTWATPTWFQAASTSHIGPGRYAHWSIQQF